MLSIAIGVASVLFSRSLAAWILRRQATFLRGFVGLERLTRWAIVFVGACFVWDGVHRLSAS